MNAPEPVAQPTTSAPARSSGRRAAGLGAMAVWVGLWAGLLALFGRGVANLPWPELLALATLASLPLVLTCVALWRVYGALVSARAAEAIARAPSAAQSPQDASEALGTRQQFIGLAEREWARCQRYGDDGALLLVDIDRLRRINESVGHRCGDAVLREVITRVGSTLRQADVMARFDGAQLAVFLAHTDPLGALDAAERIRLVVASMPFRCETAIIVVTVSVGVAQVHAGQMALDGLIQECEAALAAAKEAGRNCVRAAPILPRQSDPSRSVSPS